MCAPLIPFPFVLPLGDAPLVDASRDVDGPGVVDAGRLRGIDTGDGKEAVDG